MVDLSHTSAAPYADEINFAAHSLVNDGRPHSVTEDRLAQLAAAVGERETHWGKMRGKNGSTGASIVGFDGHGRGLMQIDDRYHPLSDWNDPATNIRAGTALLLANLDHYGGDEPQAVAAYNCGFDGVDRALSEGLDVDAHTTGRNYSKDVLGHAKAWFGS